MIIHKAHGSTLNYLKDDLVVLIPQGQTYTLLSLAKS